MDTKIEYAMSLLSGKILEAVKNYPELSEVDEIRLRTSRPLSLSVGKSDVILDCTASSEDIEFAFKTAFSYSLHSYSKELANGYITTRGGNRVGISGTAVVPGNSDKVETLKYISSVNIRIAREVRGCADEIMNCYSDGLPGGILVVGPPSSGKTTVLRDICRSLGSVSKISLIDELNEISATYRNEAQNDVGLLTDVFSGYPKHVGIATAVRVMSPRAMVADEIGTQEDVKALEYALHSGVRLITAVHGESFDDASKKPAVRRLLEEKAFSLAAELSCDRKLKVIKID